MPSPNLLVTGVTGFIGFKVLLNALEEGYTVRAAVRSISQSESLLSHPKIKALAPGDKLSFVEVPDLGQADAYDEALKGVTYVIHLASPLPSPFLDPQTGIYEPTVKSVTNILNAALKAPSLKKLVITSSVFANIPFPPDPSHEITPESRLPDLPGPFDAMLPAYSAAKINSLNATDRFVKEKNPPFTVVNILPGFVFGPDDKALNLKELTAGTNRVLVPIITGQTADSPMPAGCAHVYDVAKVHLLALKDGVKGNLGVTSNHAFDDAWEIVKKHFPKAVKEGIFTQGHQPTVPVNWNAHQTEIELGFNYKTYEDVVVDVASQYLELSGKEKA
ncbi:putative cinnamoyl-CoA reductase [Xylariaceae sp. FL0662B]|nr:putative cinnamoyl-CoA reductase [Xylariaceae sp. FL0662B]